MEPIVLPRISEQKPLVSVVSFTYNHEPYIRDCLEGFLMQKTSFPVEVIIHDDASTDQTADILREYYNKRPDLFHVIIERDNQYSQHKSISSQLYELAQGKYIALCEGDDYWIDPNKLQRQFDFMEAHTGFTVCGTRNLIMFQETNKLRRRRRRRGREIITLGTVMSGNPFTTCTTFLDKKTVQKWGKISSNFDKTKWKMGDLPLFIYCMTQGKGYIMSHTTSCYRVLSISASHGDRIKRLSFADSGIHIRLALIKELNLPFSSDQIIKQWAWRRVKKALVWKDFDSPYKLKYYWKIYWKKGFIYTRPICFFLMFIFAYTLSLFFSHTKK
jgi:glycosyltransferase involved in cell wall biosynthesis